MEVYDKLIKPIREVNYLRVENVDRYRVIIRYFFLEYEKIHYWLHKEDVYSMMIETHMFENYTMDQCQQDLQSLVDWGNLTAIQDSNKVRTIEDFKNKKYRYQLSEYSVEIERMTIRLEKLETEGASLEPTLLERIYNQLMQYEQMQNKNTMEINGWLQLLLTDFIRLNQNYQDYIKTLNSAKAEELMKTTEFLVFKDKLINYLRTFVMIMQDKGGLIADLLKHINEDELDFLLKKAAEYELSIPRLDVELVFEDVYTNFKDKWNSLYRWFIGTNGISEMDRLYDVTNEIIRKMTRYAQQIAEMTNRGSNRKELYYHLINVFGKCEDINEAHKLSAFVFGVEDCIHLNYIKPRMSDDINGSVFKESPSAISFDPHSRIARKKYVRKPANDYTLEREMQRIEIEKQLEQEKERINQLIDNNTIDFKNLPTIHASTRKKLLTWLSKALEQPDFINKTDEGDIYYIDDDKMNEEIVMKCEDGEFVMPHFRIIFKRKE